MQVTKAQDFFDVLSTHRVPPQLLGAGGTWEIDVEPVGAFSIGVNRGTFSVARGPAKNPTARIILSEQELVKLANGADHEHLVTAVLRGALKVEGDIGFAQKLRVVLPLPDDWRAEP